MARGREFTDRRFGLRKRSPTGKHEFDQLYTDLGIEHPSPAHPQTNGSAGQRSNGGPAARSNASTAASGSCCNRTTSARARSWKPRCTGMWLYNQQLPQSALGSKTPLQAMKDWHTRKPELFRKQPYFRTGCDTYAPVLGEALFAPCARRIGSSENGIRCCDQLRGSSARQTEEFGTMGIFDRLRLDGKKLFITGGSRGLGREMALGMAEAGADVTLVAREPAALEKTAADIRAFGRSATTIIADMSDPEIAEAACEQALRDHGPFDILVNNIGGRRVNIPTEDMPLDQWRALVDLNLTTTFVCCKHIGGAMVRRGQGGRVINIASINAMVAGRNITGRHYEAAKAGVLMLTRSLAVDWARHSITVNAICPGIFATDPNKVWAQKNPEIINAYIETIPMGKLGEPEDLAALAVYLASDTARYMTGASLVIDGGYTCL